MFAAKADMFADNVAPRCRRCQSVSHAVYSCPGMCSRTPRSRPRPRPDHFGSRPRTPMKSFMISEAP